MAKPRKSSPSLASHVLKEYRKAHNLTQEQLACELHMEPRTYRAYETGEYSLTNINELRRIADLLGIEPERLGIVSSAHIPYSSEEIEAVIEHIWSLIDASRLYEARNTIEHLIQNLRTQIATEDKEVLRSFARAYHTAGYVVSEATRANESYAAIRYYEQMEAIARTLNDDALLNIALTYQGDMFRRLGSITKAITYLEAARDTTPQADSAARGNGIQLLARAYLRKGDLGHFEQAMAEAEALASTFDPAASSTQGHYNLGTVYEEYGRSYTELGQTQKALDYLDRAQSALPPTKFWELLVVTSRAEAFVKGGEFHVGVQMAIEAAEQIQAAGIQRYMDRIYGIQQYLDRLTREIGQITLPLRELLDGGQYTEI
ncbi:MAG TPA: helix-turn-helix transcriptional regulator [Ktedonobacteraceae bacterium]|nr:helix-turn-helix transcriptional regulator [Ktedonobacteraceae bacterium]